jgi:hypothetical protein
VTIPFKAGDFVWSLFPFVADPGRPGPERHASLVLGVLEPKEANLIRTMSASPYGLVVSIYTSSQVEKFGIALPIGIVQVRAAQADRLGGQKPFFIDARRRAFLPCTREFFPDLGKPGDGVIGASDRLLFEQVQRHVTLINDRHRDLIVNVGPLRPRR